MKMLILLFTFLMNSFAFAQTAPFFTYEGILTDGSGVPITTSQTVTFQIIYGGSCVVFEESQSVTPGTNGEFSVIVGTGSRSDTTGNTVSQVFGSAGSVNCFPTGTSTISGFSTRQLHIRVGGVDLTPDVTLTNVPFALNAQRLGDKAAADFVQIKTANNLTQANVESVFTRFSVLDQILDGNFTSVIGGITNLTDASISASAAISRSKLAAGTANHVLINNASGVMSSEAQLAVTRGGTGSSTVPSVGQVLIGDGTKYSPGSIVGGAGISITTNASSITIDSTSSSPTGAAGGDLAGTYPNPTVGKIGGTSLNTTTWITGQVLRFDGTNLVNSAIVGSDLPLSGATAGTYKSVTVDNRGRVTAGTNPTTVAGFGITDAITQSGNSLGAPISIGSNDAQSFSIKTNTFTRVTIDQNGAVGIGTAAPTEKLEVVGKVKGSELCIGTDCRAAWPSGGGGGVTQVNTGTGLTGGPITATGTIELGAELAGFNGLGTTGFINRTGTGAYTTMSANSFSIPSSLVSRDATGNSVFNTVTLNSGAMTVAQHAPGFGTSYDLTWPSNLPAINGMILSSDAFGNMEWVNPAISSTEIVDGSITNADINASAAIARTKLAAGTPNRVLINDVSGNIGSAAISTDELGHLSGVTANIQSQLNGIATTVNDRVSKAGDTMTGHLKMSYGTEIRFQDSGNVNYVALRGPATSSPVTFTLPSVDGSAGQVLQTNGSGVLNWMTPIGAAAGTANHAAYFNGSGSLASEQYLSVSRGGTGVGSFPANGLVMAGGIGTAPLSAITCAVAGRVLEWTGATWACSGDLLTSGGGGTKVNYIMISGGAGTIDPIRMEAMGGGTTIDIQMIPKNGAVKVDGNMITLNETVSRTFRTTASVDNGAGFAISFSGGNLQYTSASCASGTFNLSGLKDGATYVLAVKGSGGGTCSFTANSGTLTVKYPPDYGPTDTGKHTLFTFMVIGTDVYVSWVAGY